MIYIYSITSKLVIMDPFQHTKFYWKIVKRTEDLLGLNFVDRASVFTLQAISSIRK